MGRLAEKLFIRWPRRGSQALWNLSPLQAAQAHKKWGSEEKCLLDESGDGLRDWGLTASLGLERRGGLFPRVHKGFVELLSSIAGTVGSVTPFLLHTQMIQQLEAKFG